MRFKQVKKLVPWCEDCKSEIRGNGSGVMPYHCNCGEWKYSHEDNDYKLKK